MAAWSSIIWNETTRLIENGPKDCDIPKSTLYLRCAPARISELRDRKDYDKLQSRPRISLNYFKKVNRLDITTKRTSKGVYYFVKGSTAQQLTVVKNKLRPVDSNTNVQTEEGKSGPLVLFTKNRYAKLGW